MSSQPAFTTPISFATRPQSLLFSTCPRRPRPASTHYRVKCAAGDPNQLLTTEQLDEWKQVSSLVQNLNTLFTPADADKVVGRAFGWGTQKFWRGDVKQEAPSLEQVELAVGFLKDAVGLDEKGIGMVVKKFPEVLRLRTERMKGNLEYVQSNYPHIKGALLVNSVKETPAVLGFDFNCEGDCKSECARCWVQF